MDCPTCEGIGCDECDNGIFEINECPNELLGSASLLIQLSEQYEKGMAPFPGGVMNQSSHFLKLHEQYQHERFKISELDDVPR